MPPAEPLAGRAGVTESWSFAAERLETTVPEPVYARDSPLTIEPAVSLATSPPDPAPPPIPPFAEWGRSALSETPPEELRLEPARDPLPPHDPWAEIVLGTSIAPAEAPSPPWEAAAASLMPLRAEPEPPPRPIESVAAPTPLAVQVDSVAPSREAVTPPRRDAVTVAAVAAPVLPEVATTAAEIVPTPVEIAAAPVEIVPPPPPSAPAEEPSFTLSAESIDLEAFVKELAEAAAGDARSATVLRLPEPPVDRPPARPAARRKEPSLEKIVKARPNGGPPPEPPPTVVAQPPPTPEPPQAEMLEMLSAIRRDLELLKTERSSLPDAADPSTPTADVPASQR